MVLKHDDCPGQCDILGVREALKDGTPNLPTVRQTDKSCSKNCYFLVQGLSNVDNCCKRF